MSKYIQCVIVLLIILVSLAPCFSDEWMIYCSGELDNPENEHSYLGEYFLRGIVLPEGGMYLRCGYIHNIDKLSNIPTDEAVFLKSLYEIFGSYSTHFYIQISDQKDHEGMQHIEALCILSYDIPWSVPSYIYEPYNFSGEKKTDIFNLLTKLSQLRHLELYSFIMDNHRFAEVTKLPKLEYIGLPQNCTDEHLKHITDLKKLKYVNASGTKIRGDGLKYLSKLPHLRTLDIRHNQLNRGALALLKSSKSLETLLLSESNVNDEDLYAITSLKTLKYITLHYTGITDKGLKSLAQLKNLQYVSLHNTKTTKSGRAILTQNHPCLTLDVEPLQNWHEFWMDREYIMAQSGNATTQKVLARIYRKGWKYTPKDYIESLKWHIVCSTKIDMYDREYEAEILEQIKYLEDQLTEREVTEAQRRARAYLYLQKRRSCKFEIERKEGLPLYQYGFDTID